MVIIVGWVGGISQNTPAKETPIKGTLVKNEGWWGVGEMLGTVEDGGWWREVASRHPFCRGVPAGADISCLHRFVPHISCNITKEENIQEIGNT